MKRLPQSYICIPKQKRPQDTFPRPREKQAVVVAVVVVAFDCVAEKFSIAERQVSDVVVGGGDGGAVVVVDSVAEKFSIPETQVAVAAHVFDVVEKIPVGHAQQKYFSDF